MLSAMLQDTTYDADRNETSLRKTTPLLSCFLFIIVFCAAIILLTTTFVLHDQNKKLRFATRNGFWMIQNENETRMWNEFSVDFNASDFLEEYRNTCLNSTWNYTTSSDLQLDLCPCVPGTLIGGQSVKINKRPRIEAVVKSNPEVQQGGYWKPLDCFSRDRVAIIIPFRDRQSHLNILLKYLHPLLQRQLIEYRIFVVEQAYPKVFNKASLMNAGYLEAKKIFNFDCVVFHDVDMIPEDDRNFFTCMNSPRHVGAYLSKWKYKVLYRQLVGGAVLFKPHEFEAVNGFSNQYFGWGGEDDDMSKRILYTGLHVYRYPSTVARYSMIPHRKDKGNPNNDQRFSLLDNLKTIYQKEGLNSIKYQVKERKQLALFTWIHVKLKNKYIR